jgi:hypothetical protein
MDELFFITSIIRIIKVYHLRAKTDYTKLREQYFHNNSFESESVGRVSQEMANWGFLFAFFAKALRLCENPA